MYPMGVKSRGPSQIKRESTVLRRPEQRSAKAPVTEYEPEMYKVNAHRQMMIPGFNQYIVAKTVWGPLKCLQRMSKLVKLS